MNTLNVKTEKKSKTLIIRVSGKLDENSIFQKPDFKEISTVEIDLKDLVSVTSKGVRAWMLWLKVLDQNKKYFLKNCPKTFISLSGLIAGIIPNWMSVASLELPYFC